jgi:peptidoglycan/LPS O-acetylase OafA/YrhL
MSHIHGFDLLRIVSITAVVGIHALHTDPQLAEFNRNFSFAVPCFVLMAVYLSERSLQSGERFFLWRRVVRLLPAFLAWTGLYVIARWWIGGIPGPSIQSIAQFIFLGSAALHLYFIPMLIYYSFGVAALPKSNRLRVTFSVLGLCVAFLIRYSGTPDIQLGSSEADAFPVYFIYNLPYLFIGILLFHVSECSAAANWIRKRAVYLACLCAIGTAILWSVPHVDPLWIPVQDVVRDTLLFLTFLFLPYGMPRGAVVLSSVSFGIYLSHHMVLEGLMRVETLLALVSSDFMVTLARYAVGLLISACTCVLVARSKTTAWVVR